MSSDTQSETHINQLPEAAREVARRAADAARETAHGVTATVKDAIGAAEEMAGDVTDATKDAARCATETAKEIYQSAVIKAGDTLETSKEYVRRNPVPVVLGAAAFGAALGYLLIMARRKPTFGERYAEEPIGAVREAIMGAFAPVSKRVHKGYDSARDGAAKAMDRVQAAIPGRCGESLPDHLGRIGSNLKFW